MIDTACFMFGVLPNKDKIASLTLVYKITVTYVKRCYIKLVVSSLFWFSMGIKRVYLPNIALNKHLLLYLILTKKIYLTRGTFSIGTLSNSAFQTICIIDLIDQSIYNVNVKYPQTETSKCHL